MKSSVLIQYSPFYSNTRQNCQVRVEAHVGFVQVKEKKPLPALLANLQGSDLTFKERAQIHSVTALIYRLGAEQFYREQHRTEKNTCSAAGARHPAAVSLPKQPLNLTARCGLAAGTRPPALMPQGLTLIYKASPWLGGREFAG